jgi:hypothetical protein
LCNAEALHSETFPVTITINGVEMKPFRLPGQTGIGQVHLQIANMPEAEWLRPEHGAPGFSVRDGDGNLIILQGVEHA